MNLVMLGVFTALSGMAALWGLLKGGAARDYETTLITLVPASIAVVIYTVLVFHIGGLS